MLARYRRVTTKLNLREGWVKSALTGLVRSRGEQQRLVLLLKLFGKQNSEAWFPPDNHESLSSIGSDETLATQRVA